MKFVPCLEYATTKIHVRKLKVETVQLKSHNSFISFNPNNQISKLGKNLLTMHIAGNIKHKAKVHTTSHENRKIL